MASDLRMTAGRGPRDCNLKQYLHCRPYRGFEPVIPALPFPQLDW